MITPNEANQLATDTVEEYVNKCNCKTPEDVANVLMKLASMCGVAMCATVGQENAVARLQGTTNYIARPENMTRWDKQIIQ